MAISSSGGGDSGPMTDINTTPLVDVMLVLLIIFLIAIPVVIETVDIELPIVKFNPTKAKNENILLTVSTTDAEGRDPGDPGYSGVSRNGDCRIYRNVTPVDSTQLLEDSKKHMTDAINALGGEAAARSGLIKPEDLPEAHIRGDVETPFKCVGGVIHIMKSAGFQRIAFVSSPVEIVDVKK